MLSQQVNKDFGVLADLSAYLLIGEQNGPTLGGWRIFHAALQALVYSSSTCSRAPQGSGMVIQDEGKLCLPRSSGLPQAR